MRARLCDHGYATTAMRPRPGDHGDHGDHSHILRHTGTFTNIHGAQRGPVRREARCRPPGRRRGPSPARGLRPPEVGEPGGPTRPPILYAGLLSPALLREAWRTPDRALYRACCDLASLGRHLTRAPLLSAHRVLYVPTSMDSPAATDRDKGKRGSASPQHSSKSKSPDLPSSTPLPPCPA
jgi:hypothetical protein